MLELFAPYPTIFSIISILLNILIAIIGILPSTIITLGTVGVLGFNLGVVILIIGEAVGAIISFTLYRRGLRKLSTYPKFNKFENRFLAKLKESDGVEAILIVVLLRVLPFVPSGIVTLTAAISKIGLLPFSIASTLGKIPAIILEAYSVIYFLNLGTQWQVLIAVVILLLFLFYQVWKNSSKNRV
ncbi:VTT domain-containing protein [Robertmurraya massiliosenegalensis]|uniref:TVP38/TMEM64 family protein n=1 Tax=Robertmurraya TaxID=2837507 RepID=UPI0039A43800